MGTSVKAPEARNYLSEMQSALGAQTGIQSQLINAENQYIPQWQAVQQQALAGQMGTLGNLYGNAIPQSEALQGQMLASQGGLYGQVGGYARNAYQQTLDPTTAGLYNTMASQAAGGLASGRNLNPQETQMAQQSARAAMASRGMQSGNQAIAAEVLNSYNMQNMREDRARQYAGQVYGIGQQNATQAMSMYGTPLMSQMNQLSAPSMFAQAQQMYGGLGSKLFQPESQYNAGLISANQQNEMQARMATAQNRAGLIGGVIKAAGAIGGAMMSMPPTAGIGSAVPDSFGMGSMGASNYGSSMSNYGSVGSLSGGGASMNYGSNYNNYGNMA